MARRIFLSEGTKWEILTKMYIVHVGYLSHMSQTQMIPFSLPVTE